MIDQLMTDKIQDATAHANTFAKQEREALANLETALRESDEYMAAELQRILTDQIMRRAEIVTLIDKIKGGLGQINFSLVLPPPLPENDLPRIARKAKDPA